MNRGSVRRRRDDVQPILVLLAIGGLLLGACGGMRPEVQSPEDPAPAPPPPVPAPVLSAGASAPTGITVRWTVPDTELVIAGYELRWRRAGDPGWTMVSDIAGTATEYTITGLEAATAYEIQVRARHAAEEGEWSNLFTAATAESPPELSQGERTPTAVTVTWTAPGTDLDITGYELRWRRAGDPSWTTVSDIASTATEYTITGLEAATAYEIQVRARYTDEEGEWSDTGTVQTAAHPTPSPPPPRSPPRDPPIFQVTMVTTTSITLQWTATDTAVTGYDLRWKSGSSLFYPGWESELRVPSTDPTYTISSLSAGRHLVGARTRTGDVAGEWYYAGVATGREYHPANGPRFSIVSDDAIYDEGDGAIVFKLVTPDTVSEAVTVSLLVQEEESMLQRLGTYEVRVGAGRTEATFRVALEVDTVDEPDSYAYATVLNGLNYDYGESFIAVVRVRDDD